MTVLAEDRHRGFACIGCPQTWSCGIKNSSSCALQCFVSIPRVSVLEEEEEEELQGWASSFYISCTTPTCVCVRVCGREQEGERASGLEQTIPLKTCALLFLYATHGKVSTGCLVNNSIKILLLLPVAGTAAKAPWHRFSHLICMHFHLLVKL